MLNGMVGRAKRMAKTLATATVLLLMSTAPMPLAAQGAPGDDMAGHHGGKCGDAERLTALCDWQGDYGEGNKTRRRHEAADWADSVAVDVDMSCHACTAGWVDTATADYAKALRIRYPSRPASPTSLPRLDDREIARLPILAPLASELEVTYRQSMMNRSLVAVFKNHGETELVVSARFSNPATAESRVFTLHVPRHGFVEFGHLEGWALDHGHTIEVSAQDFQAFVIVVN